MSQSHSVTKPSDSQNNAPSTREARKPLIDRLIDPSNVVFSLVFCQQTRREFEVQQAS